MLPKDLSLYRLILTHCTVKLQMFGSDAAGCLAMGVALSFSQASIWAFLKYKYNLLRTFFHQHCSLFPLRPLYSSKLLLSSYFIIIFSYLPNHYGVGHRKLHFLSH